jgi:naphtho-gamma-pyrone polyketide synthase
MERSTQLLLFGDQTTSIETGLRQLLRIKGNVVLTAFLEQVHFAIRKEISHLSVSERGHFPRSTSVVELLTKYNEKRNAALDSTLTCIYQLGCFIK